VESEVSTEIECGGSPKTLLASDAPERSGEIEHHSLLLLKTALPQLRFKLGDAFPSGDSLTVSLWGRCVVVNFVGHSLSQQFIHLYEPFLRSNSPGLFVGLKLHKPVVVLGVIHFFGRSRQRAVSICATAKTVSD
jgi:hypothetical protein